MLQNVAIFGAVVVGMYVFEDKIKKLVDALDKDVLE